MVVPTSLPLRRSYDPPTLLLTSLASGPWHGHALSKDVEAFSGVTVLPRTPLWHAHPARRAGSDRVRGRRGGLVSSSDHRERGHASGVVDAATFQAHRRGGALHVLMARAGRIISGAGFSKSVEHFASVLPMASRFSAQLAYGWPSREEQREHSWSVSAHLRSLRCSCAWWEVAGSQSTRAASRACRFGRDGRLVHAAGSRRPTGQCGRRGRHPLHCERAGEIARRRPLGCHTHRLERSRGLAR